MYLDHLGSFRLVTDKSIHFQIYSAGIDCLDCLDFSASWKKKYEKVSVRLNPHSQWTERTI